MINVQYCIILYKNEWKWASAKFNYALWEPLPQTEINDNALLY